MNGSGYYIATLSATTGERIRDHGLYERGDGEWSFDCETLDFCRHAGSGLIRIPFRSIRSISLGTTWWGGKWFFGTRVVLVEWTDGGGRVVTSGFILSTSSANQGSVVEELKVAIAGG